MLLALSLGNTNLRYLLLDDGGADIRRGYMPLAETQFSERTFEWGRRASRVVIGSVNPSRCVEIERVLGAIGLPVSVAGRDFEVPLRNRYRDPREVGIDRLLGVVGARQLFPGEGVVVVDFGTATTVNVGSPEGEFLGGAIGIGATTAALAIAERAPRLPRVEFEPIDETAVPDETRAALRHGLLLQAAGGVERIIAGLQRALDWPFHVVATGGDAERVAPSIAAVERVEPDLVLHGLVESWRARG